MRAHVISFIEAISGNGSTEAGRCDSGTKAAAEEGARLVDETVTVRAMGIMRVISGSIEIAAALLIWRMARVETAIQINAALGLVGPAFFISVTLLGIAGLTDKLSVTKLLMIVAGVVLIFLGGRK